MSITMLPVNLGAVLMTLMSRGRTPHSTVPRIPITKRTLRRSHWRNHEEFSDLLRRSNIPRESLLCDLTNNFYLDPICIPGCTFF
ncbi:hypothetical protein F4604DRAFT_1817531, partial [Suillus subluteus]